MHQFPIEGVRATGLAFSPDSKILATTGNPVCHLWDTATGKELRQLQGHQDGLRSVAFSPDGKHLTTTSYDLTARIWDVRSGKELYKLDCNQGYPLRAAYSPDGKLLATAGTDGTIRMWDTATGKEIRRLIAHKKAIFGILFSPDGKLLVSSGDDKTIRLWDAATGKLCRVLASKWVSISGGSRFRRMANGWPRVRVTATASFDCRDPNRRYPEAKLAGCPRRRLGHCLLARRQDDRHWLSLHELYQPMGCGHGKGNRILPTYIADS